MAEKIEFDLKVGANELQKALSDATTGSKKLGGTISTALGTFAGNAALKGFSLLGDAIGSVSGFLKDSVKAAQVQETALNKLAQSLRLTGEFSNSAVDDLANFASELQKVSIFGDEVIIGQIAIAKSFGATNEQAKELLTAAANLSATLGGSLEQNVQLLGKSLGGLVARDLKAAVPELQSLSRQAIASGEAIRLVNERFGGAASGELATYAGATTSLSNAFGDLQEEIGFFITKSEVVGSVIRISKDLVIELSEAIKTYRTEQERANGTLEETDTTLTQLSGKYATITGEIERYQSVIDADKNKTLLESLFSFDNAPLAQERVRELNIELAKLDRQIEEAAAKVQASKSVTGKPKEAASTEQELNQIRKLEAQKTLLVQQAELERQNVLKQLANESLLNEFDRSEAEIQRINDFELKKRDLENQFALEKAETLANPELKAAEIARIDKENELFEIREGNKKLLAEQQLKIKRDQDSIFFFKKFEEKTNRERVDDLKSTFSTIATLSESGNKTLAAIGKASAISTATIDGFVAVNKALASAPPPLNFALAAAVGAATAANVAKIAGVQGFAAGGIVGQQGASSGGDNRVATVRDGELILNAQQQKNLFDAIDSGNLSGGNIIVQIDGRNIASAVRDQVRGGFRID